jgi:excisionase family DNA binding protein
MSNNSLTAAVGTDQLFLRVEDAARLLGISRSLAYDMANQWIDSNGQAGLPTIRLGRRLLVNRSALQRWADDVGGA